MENQIKDSKKYLNDEERALYIQRYQNEIDKINLVIKELEKTYIDTAKKEEKKRNPNVKKLNKIEHKILKNKTKVQRLTIDLERINNGSFVKLNFFEKIVKYFETLSFDQQQALGGYTLILPWVIGFGLLFAVPLLTTIYWSFNDVSSVAGGLTIKWNGIKNYISLFTTQMLGTRTFLEVLTTSIQEMIINVPVIFIFSMLVAVVLNTKFKGHQIFKAIFFIPVIYNSTVINLALKGSFGTTMDGAIASFSQMVSSIQGFLLSMGFGEGLISFLIGAVDRIFTIVTKSGIQILIFIAALQSIPKNLYEAAKIEGATTYDCFCKITVPSLSKMFLPVLIYSIVDCFADSDLINIMTKDSTGAKISYGVSSSIAVIYFLVNLLIIAVIALVLKKVNNNE